MTEEEFRALLEVRRLGRVENGDLRLLVGLDTLKASLLLRRLRDRGLLELHAHGANSFYTLPDLPGQQSAVQNNVMDRGEQIADRGEQTADRGEQTADRGEQTADRGERTTDRGEHDQELPGQLREAIAQLGSRPRKERLREVIAAICSHREWTTPAELARWLDILPANLTDRHLSPMVKAGQLERRYPNTVTHADQAYRCPDQSRNQKA